MRERLGRALPQWPSRGPRDTPLRLHGRVPFDELPLQNVRRSRASLLRDDAEALEEQALLRLRDRLNDAQVILLMSYGNFRRTMGDMELRAFWDAHPGLFGVHPPTFGSSEEERDVVGRCESTTRQRWKRWACFVTPKASRSLANSGSTTSLRSVACSWRPSDAIRSHARD